MAAAVKELKDNAARLVAITAHGRSILVEAGAGSGKTAVMAGRIALMLAEGVAPRSIAAVTFTELAASELLLRVREFVADLLEDKIAPELRIALPAGLSEAQRANLSHAASDIDEITCSTIHGFCQRLIKPYPPEADIDPGAGIIDRSQSDLAFAEIVDNWLRERLSGDQGWAHCRDGAAGSWSHRRSGPPHRPDTAHPPRSGGTARCPALAATGKVPRRRGTIRHLSAKRHRERARDG